MKDKQVHIELKRKIQQENAFNINISRSSKQIWSEAISLAPSNKQH